MPRVRLNGCDFRYELKGPGPGRAKKDGPELVFIHGEIHGLDLWEHQMEAFSRDYRCLAYDRRGHAGTEFTSFGYSVTNQARDLAALLEHFDLQRPVLVALAFGTTIAATFALDHPERVRAMVLIAWSELYEARAYLERWEQAGVRAARALEEGGREKLLALLHAEGGKSIFKVIPPPGSPLRERVIELLASHPAEEYRRGMLEMASSVPLLVPRLRGLELPVLGVCGTEDPFPNRPAELAGMPSFREAPPIPGGGRFVNWEQPQAFNRLLRQFIEQEI